MKRRYSTQLALAVCSLMALISGATSARADIPVTYICDDYETFAGSKVFSGVGFNEDGSTFELFECKTSSPLYCVSGYTLREDRGGWDQVGPRYAACEVRACCVHPDNNGGAQ